MKKIKGLISILTAAALSAVLTVFCFAEFKASFSLTGPDSVRAGNTLTVQFKADGNGICGILADITYDSSKLSFKSQSGVLSDWKVEVTEKSGKLQIWAEENNGFKSPIKSQKSVVSLNFRVSDNVSAGEKISVKANISQVSDTENELSGLSASYTVTVARPLSTDSSLKSLSVEGYTLKPDFSPKVTEYEIEGDVEYTQSALKINAKTNDGEASVDISGARLSVGGNTVTVKVTAENDSSTTTYKIRANMKQDPNYTPSSDASLASLGFAEGAISPAFSPDRFDYIVYVPFEVERAAAEMKPADGKAAAEAEGPETLAVGENLYVIRCTAEDGTSAEYRVVVMRMDEYTVNDVTDTETETITETETETATDTETETETEAETETGTETDTEAEPLTETDTEAEETTDKSEGALTKSVPLWAVLAASVGGIATGALGSVLVLNSLKERKQ